MNATIFYDNFSWTQVWLIKLSGLFKTSKPHGLSAWKLIYFCEYSDRPIVTCNVDNEVLDTVAL